MNLPIRIASFTGPWAFLSNFAPGEVQLWVTADGMVYAHEVPDAVIEVYASVEHAYQAAKTLNAAVREKFRFAGVTPGRAKKMGRSLKLRPDWEERTGFRFETEHVCRRSAARRRCPDDP